MQAITCVQCGKERTLTPHKARTQRYCSNRCARASRSAWRVPYKAVSVPGHPLAGANGAIRVHRMVLFDKLGPGPQRCHWCGKAIEWTAKGSARCLADHLDGDTHNNEPGNLVPSCSRCNTARAGNDQFLTRCVNGHRRCAENVFFKDGIARCRLCRDAGSQRAYARKSGKTAWRRHWARDDLIAAWEQLRADGQPRERAAEQLGVSIAAVYKAYERARLADSSVTQ